MCVCKFNDEKNDTKFIIPLIKDEKLHFLVKKNKKSNIFEEPKLKTHI